MLENNSFFLENNMEEIAAEINIIKTKVNIIDAILAYPRKYPEKTAEERFEELRKNFPDNDSLFTYIGYSEEKLQIEKTQLQKEKTQLQNEKALLLEKEVKLITPKPGKLCFDFHRIPLYRELTSLSLILSISLSSLLFSNLLFSNLLFSNLLIFCFRTNR